MLQVSIREFWFDGKCLYLEAQAAEDGSIVEIQGPQ
jgi:hypothetical protein